MAAVAAANLLHFIGGLLHDKLGLDFEPPLVRAVLEARERDDLQCVPTTDTMAYSRDDTVALRAAWCILPVARDMLYFACCMDHSRAEPVVRAILVPVEDAQLQVPGQSRRGRRRYAHGSARMHRDECVI
jgi:hypothetical protein